MTARGLFITGTDTGIGKTHVAAAVIAGLVRRGHRVAGMKPVASGCEQNSAGEWENADALALQQAAAGNGNPVPAYGLVNPYPLPDPLAPVFAARQARVCVEQAVIQRGYQRLSAQRDLLVVEGVGGWRVPLAEDLDTVTLVRALGLPVLLVVGLRLGCINHARLTADTLVADGVECYGWVGNTIDADYRETAATLAALKDAIEAPFLGFFSWQPENHPLAPATLLDRIEQDLLRP